MPKTLSDNQTKKIDRPYLQPIYLVHLLLDSATLHFSDRNITYNSINYEAYFSDLSGIGNEVRNLGGYDNAIVTLNFINERFRDKNYLLEYFDKNPPEKRYIEIYKLNIDTGEEFGSDVSTKIFKGVMGEPYGIDDPPTGFKIDCCSMLFGKNDKLPLDVIDRTDFPSADPDDIGKYRNILYGSIKKMICPWTLAGWATTLVEDIDSSTTSIEVSDIDGMPSIPFTAICDNEEIRVTNNSTVILTVTRGYNGTTATAHSRGAFFYEKIALLHAEVAQHPVKSIGDVFVERRGEWVRIKTGATKYTNSGGRAYIALDPAQISFEEKINITVNTTVTSEGSHPHGLTVGNITKECIPTSAGGSGDNVTNAIDGNTASYAGIDESETVTAYFTESSMGDIVKTIIRIYKNTENATGYVQCPNGTNLTTLGAGVGWFRVVKVGGEQYWDDSVTVVGGSGGNQIGEIQKEIEYTPSDTTQWHAATGIDVDSTLSGNSVANLLIGDRVACDVEGYQDDGSGTYTGTPDALIERPDHVRKHILIALLGIVPGDIDSTSFTSVGTTYAGRISGGYKFSFNLPDVTPEAMDLFEQIDFCTRSTMFESQGKFRLSFNFTEGAAPTMIFDANNIKGKFHFSKTKAIDIKNRIRGHFYRDYTKLGSIGDRYMDVNEIPDSDSITKYGDIGLDVEFPCIGDLSDMADDILDWLIEEYKEMKKVVSFDALWDAAILDHCDLFQVNSNVWSGRLFKAKKILERPKDQVIEIKGLQLVIPPDYELDLRPYDLFIRDDYCYICGVRYHDSKYWPTVVKIQLSATVFTPIDSAEHGSGETGTLTGYYGIYVDESHNVYVCGRVDGTGKAAIVRKLSGADLSSISWTQTKEPSSGDDHMFNDVLKDGTYIYTVGYRYTGAAYLGLAYKFADSDGAQSWEQYSTGKKLLGVGGLYGGNLYVFGNDADVRTIWKLDDSDGSTITTYTYDSSSKESFEKCAQDTNYWYIAGKHIDGSNYKYGSSCLIAKSDLVKTLEVLRDSVSGTSTEYATKMVIDETDGYVIGSYFDLVYESYRAVFEKRPLNGSSETWEKKHEQPYQCYSAIGLYGDFFYVGTYAPGQYTGWLERRSKSDGELAGD